jgi:hypothetical protein
VCETVGAQACKDGQRSAWRLTRRVQVFNAYQPLAARIPGPQPTGKRRQQ